MIRFAKETDIDSVVGLYTKYIENSFFTTLGTSFLRKLFKSLIPSSYGMSFIFMANSRSVGFISSSSNYSAFLKRFFLKNGFILSVLVLHSLIKNPIVLRRLWESLLYARKIMQDSIKAEMLFIAIEPVYRLQGVATELISYTLAEMKRRGIKKVKVSTDQSNIVVNRLLQKLGFDFVSAFQLYGKKMCLYHHTI